MCLVSVVLPAYNHADYVAYALDSIYKQTHPSIELIVVDDASRDDTADICADILNQDAYGRRFKNIIFVKNPQNIGAYASINMGLEAAHGEWLTILNSDDMYEPSRIQKLLAITSKEHKDFAFSNVLIINECGRMCLDQEIALRFMTMGERLDTYSSIGTAILEENLAHSSGNLFFNQAIFAKVGKFANLDLAHDWDYLIRMLAYGEPAFLDEYLYYYRMHDNNTYLKLNKRSMLERLIILSRYINAVDCHNYENNKFPLYLNCLNSQINSNNYKMIFKGHTDYNRIVNIINEK